MVSYISTVLYTLVVFQRCISKFYAANLKTMVQGGLHMMSIARNACSRAMILWSFFHKYYGVLHQNLEYLLFIFSIIYNLKRHRKIFLLIWLLLSFVITQTRTPPKAWPAHPDFPMSWHKSQTKLKIWHTRNYERWQTVCVLWRTRWKHLKSWLF